MTFTYPEMTAENVPGIGRVYHTPVGAFPSVTTVLGTSAPQEKKDSLQAWRNRMGHSKADKIAQDAAQRGTNTHLMLERALRGEDPRLSEFPVAHQAMFQSLRHDVRKINTVYCQEAALYSETLRVAGRCDLIGEYSGRPALIDYKTSSRVKDKSEIGDYWLQAAAYAMFHNEMFGTNIDYLVIMMAVENHLPLIFKRELDEELVMKLVDRVDEFYRRLG